jgi:restriction system protein
MSDPMTIPSFDQFIDPLLRLLVARPDGIAARDAIDAVADAVGIATEVPAARS